MVLHKGDGQKMAIVNHQLLLHEVPGEVCKPRLGFCVAAC